MDRGVLFIGHSSDGKEKVFIGIRGQSDHVAIISWEEARMFAYQLIETVERIAGNLHPDDFDDEAEEPTD